MDDPLLELLDRARAEQAGRGRSRERSLRQQAEEDATLAGTLLDLAERRSAVTVRTATGRTHHGAALAVGHDFVVVRGENGVDTFVALAAIATVRPYRAPPASGDRVPSDTRLVDVLGAAAPDRPRVALVAGTEVVAGELRAVGADVVTVQLDGPERPLAYVSSASISEAVLFRSG